MRKQKQISVLTLLAVMLLSVTAFSSPALANGEPVATPAATPTPTPATTTKTLTPEGNLTLVDDVASASSSDKQFITVVTKSGNYFYIIIDRASESENVYFLNKVDEADLMEILKEVGYEIDVAPTPTPTARPTAEMESLDATNDEKSGGASLVLIGIFAAVAVGAFIFFRKRKSAQKSTPRMEDFEYDYDDDLDEEEPKEPKPPVCNEAVQKKGNWDGVL